ncbi:MAG TPA: phosphotransferase [Mycobacteriales bacterium]|nr:phosphotransferase [Mycobacteriales bacterium]
MNAEPPGFDRTALAAVLREWEFSITSLEYLPLGAGSHHYLARDAAANRWFVTVDVLEWKLYGMFGPTFDPWVTPDLQSGFDGLDRAFRTAVALRDAGLEFVHAPIVRPDGAVLARLGDDYAVSVFPFIDDASHSMTDRPRLLEAIGRLHACTDAVPASLPRRDSLTVPIRSQYFESIKTLRSAWDRGPFGEPARRLLRDNEGLIRELWDRCDELADEVRRAGGEWVITHGQLHSFNILRARGGAPILIDWDCVALAPRERDLGRHWDGFAEPKTRADRDAYAASCPGAEINPSAVDLYWHIGMLWGLCVSTGILHGPHVDEPDTQHMWTMLQSLVRDAREASSRRRR